MTFCLVIGFVLLFLWKWYSFRRIRMRVLQDNGIPGPEPHLIWGNMMEYFRTPNVLWDSSLIEKYGPISGYYIGAKPVILIGDPDLMKEIQETHGKQFLERPRRVPGGINPDPLRAKMLGNLPVPEWQNLRKILSPSFTPSKLKSMTDDIIRLISIFMNRILIATSNTNEIDLYPLFQDLTLDLIGKTGFGVHSNIQNNPNDPFKTAVEAEFTKSPNSYLVKFYLCFPELQWILQPARVMLQKCKKELGFSKNSALWDMGFQAVHSRIAGGLKQNDILQNMLDSSLQSDHSKIVANSVLFFEAAFETLSAGLAFIVHFLINHPEVQEKVRREIRKELELTGGQPSMESVKNMKYLDAVINEALRMCPPQTTFISRAGEQDYVYQRDGNVVCTIPKGIHVQVALVQVQNSQEFWDNPEVFNPDRHLDEDGHSSRHSCIWQPFGKGHRMCIGYRYAKQLVLPMVLVHLLSKYSLAPCAKTERKVSLMYKTATMTPKNGCFGMLKYDPLF